METANREGAKDAKLSFKPLRYVTWDATND
jgi:hypothetical protein